ncbi:MAG: SIMPL domain-containing protein [Verrucomicrobiota bacterium]
MNGTTKPHLLGMVAGLFLAVGLVLSACVATTAWFKVKTAQSISVKGSARKNVRADLMVWKGSFITQAASLLDAQKQLKRDAEKVVEFIASRGMTNVILTPITIEEVKGSLTDTNGLTQPQVLGYRLTQTVRVESSEVDRVSQLDRDSVALVERGVLFTTQSPEFIYTRAGDAKVEMLAEATKDARTRAEQIAAQGGRGIGTLQAADMGVIQIAPLYSGQTSWEGMNDTSSLDKTITAVVTATFALK